MSSSKSVKMSNTNIRSWTAKPILGSEFTESPMLQEVYVGFIRQQKSTLTAIQSISAILPGFHHLRRCSNGRLLLAPLRSNESSSTRDGLDDILSEDELKNQLKEKGFDLSLLEDKFHVMKVPAKAPRTKSQASEASKNWPVNFHPDMIIESIIDGSVFNEENLRMIERIMSLVIEAARLEAVGNESCTGAAAIVDPEDGGRILAISAARIDRHPMWHAAMLAVELVAKLHGGGVWNLKDEGHDEPAKKRRDDVDDEEKRLGESSEDKDENKDENLRTRLKRFKRRYEEDTPLCYPKSLSTLAFPLQTSLETQTSWKGRRNNGAKSTTAQQEAQRTDVPCATLYKCGPYLCTSYWVFLLTEPCSLCAMALLHSRVARIFYGTANPRVGVLGSRAVLHTMPGLNHRYRVWSGILEEECQRAVEEIEARRCSV